MSRWFSESATYLAMRVGLGAGCLAVKLLPRCWLYGLSDSLATLGFYLFRDFRTRSMRNVKVALGERLDRTEVHRIVRRSLRNFFRDFVEIGVALVVPGPKLRSEIPAVGLENLDAALTRGNGIIVLSAHLGNFFLIGTRIALEGYRVHVLVNQPSNGPFAKLMDDYRLKVQQKTIHARPRREALREIGGVLRRNELAVMIADEHRRGSGVDVPFFGHTVSARRGPATLALRTEAAVVPAYLLRDGDQGLKLVIEPELELMRKTKSKTAIQENTARMTQWLEKTVRAYPDQWNWMNIHWEDNDTGPPIAKEESVQRVTY